MIRQDRFLASQALYAVDLSSLTRAESGTVKSTGLPLYHYEIGAVWFRRRNGRDTANIGHLWDFSTDRYEEHNARDAHKFLSLTLTDGRHGGSCRSRWDGEKLWSHPSSLLNTSHKDLSFLRVMLGGYPSIPEGFDGWWRFSR